MLFLLTSMAVMAAHCTVEVPDGLDNDCDQLVDEDTDWGDDDGDGWAERDGDCDDADPDVFPHAYDEVDGVDNDCDGLIDEEDTDLDLDGDGWSPHQGDCDDSRADVHPRADDLNDGQDNDCDSVEPPVYGCQGSGGSQAIILLPLLALLFGRPAWSATDGSSLFGEVLEAREAHEQLLLRSAAEGDLDWAWDALSDTRGAHRRLLQRELAEALEAEARARSALAAADSHEHRRRRTKTELDPARIELLQAIATSYRDEDRSWRDVEGGVSPQALELWKHTADNVLLGQVWAASYWHSALDGYRGEQGPGALEPGVQLRSVPPASGKALQVALEAWPVTWTDPTRDELDWIGLIDAKSVEQEASANRLEDARDDLRRAEAATAQARRRLVELEAVLGAESTLEQDATSLAADYQRLIGQAMHEPVPMSNACWTELFWRAGTAAVIAGDRPSGEAWLRQAAAVTHGAAPDLPPHLMAAWSLAQAQVVAQGPATLRIDSRGADRIDVDGDPVEGLELTLPVGLHRVAFWTNGHMAPTIQVVALLPGAAAEVAPDDEPLRVEELPLVGLPGVPGDDSSPADLGFRVDRPAARAERPRAELAQRPADPHAPVLELGLAGLGAHGVVAGGPSAALTWFPGRLGWISDAGLVVPSQPIWLEPGLDTQLLPTLSGGPALALQGRRVEWLVGAGGFAHIGIGAGPLLRAGCLVRGAGPTLRLDVKSGADLVSHPEGARLGMVAVTLGVGEAIRL